MNRKAAILVTILLAASCGGRDALLRRKQTAPEPVTVKVMTAVKSAAGVSAGFVGTVQSDLDATLRSPADGTVKQLSAREGRPVKKGQVLAVIESETLKSAWRAAKASLDQAEDGWKRVSMVHEGGAVTEVEYMNVKAKVEQARATEAAARSALEKCTVKAPFDGVVEKVWTSRNLELIPGEPLVSIVNLGALSVDFSIPESELHKYHEGDAAVVSVPALGIEIDAVLQSKGITASALSRSYDCTVSLASRPEGLMPGMVCKVILGTDRQDSAIVIPTSAVMTDMEGRYVWTVDESGTVGKKHIRVGGYSYSGISVTGGIEDGEMVIIEGRRKVSSGMKVKVEK